MTPEKFTETLKEFKHTRYFVFQKEKAESGTPHYQGYIEFKLAVALSGLKKINPKAHWSPRRAARSFARQYCMKEDSRLEGPFEHGDWSAGGSGTRNDLARVAEVALKTGSFKACIDESPCVAIKFHTGLKAIIASTRPPRTQPPTVAIFYGKTGTGKTHKAFKRFPDLYRKAPDTTWFDGYEQQKCLLLDDFCGAASKMSLAYLLQLLDRYPISVQIKGSYVPMLATSIIITTNIHPRLWYNYARREENYNALARRMPGVFWFTDAVSEDPQRLDPDSFYNDWAEFCEESHVFKEFKDVMNE